MQNNSSSVEKIGSFPVQKVMLRKVVLKFCWRIPAHESPTNTVLTLIGVGHKYQQKIYLLTKKNKYGKAKDQTNIKTVGKAAQNSSL